MSNQKTPPKDEQDDDEGESGSGDFGKPQLKPNLEALFDASQTNIENPETQASNDAPNSDCAKAKDTFGSWEYHENSLMLFHKNLKKRLRLEQLNAPSKILKIVVALATTTENSGLWEIDNLVKALDAAIHKKFAKGLYQIANMSNDNARLDWHKGTLVQIDQAKHSAGI